MLDSVVLTLEPELLLDLDGVGNLFARAFATSMEFRGTIGGRAISI